MSISGSLRVYGSSISYFTGKLEGYLRYKGIPYAFVPMTTRYFNRIVPKATGAAQMPAAQLADGRWMTDTTPIIAWFEGQVPEPAVIPTDPAQAFVSLLLEDYADEWLWRPAMHYRWSYDTDARHRSQWLASEVLADVPLPLWLRRIIIRRRQFRGFVRGDGVTAANRAHVEGTYLRMLDALQAILATRPFLLGARPTLADFGFFGPMFRHFSLDPTPAEIMRERAPAVFAWVARVWNARAATTAGPLVDGIPDDWDPILVEIGRTYLPFLSANVDAVTAGRRRFDVAIEGVPYANVPSSRYRVWCLERLHQHYAALSAPAPVRAVLERTGCWGPLWQKSGCRSGYDPANEAPFGRGITVF